MSAVRPSVRRSRTQGQGEGDMIITALASESAHSLGERAFTYGLGSARAPGLPAVTLFFWRWYGMSLKYKNK